MITDIHMVYVICLFIYVHSQGGRAANFEQPISVGDFSVARWRVNAPAFQENKFATLANNNIINIITS